MLRAANADLAPFAFTDLASSVASEAEEVKALVGTQRTHAEAVNRLLDQKAFALSDDPTISSGPPDRESVAPNLDFAPLDAAIDRLKTASAAYDKAAAGPLAADKAGKANTILVGVEQALTDSRGLPGRPWYRHLIYAPGLLTGYGSKTLPGVREAVEGRRWEEAAEFIGRTAAVLDAVSAKLAAATQILTK